MESRLYWNTDQSVCPHRRQVDMLRNQRRPMGQRPQVINDFCGDITQITWRGGQGEIAVRDRDLHSIYIYASIPGLSSTRLVSIPASHCVHLLSPLSSGKTSASSFFAPVEPTNETGGPTIHSVSVVVVCSNPGRNNTSALCEAE
jgi:hypothetical protein